MLSLPSRSASLARTAIGAAGADDRVGGHDRLAARRRGAAPAPALRSSPSPRLLASNALPAVVRSKRAGVAPTTNCRDARSIVIDLRKGDRIGLYDDGVFLEPSSRRSWGSRSCSSPTEHDVVIGAARATAGPATSGDGGGTPRICIAGR